MGQNKVGSVKMEHRYHLVVVSGECCLHDRTTAGNRAIQVARTQSMVSTDNAPVSLKVDKALKLRSRDIQSLRASESRPLAGRQHDDARDQSNFRERIHGRNFTQFLLL